MQESQQDQNQKEQSINKFEFTEQEFDEFKQLQNYEDFNFKPILLKGIFDYGLEQPSYVQKKIIYPIISKRNICVQATSGSGKIDALMISTLQLIDEDRQDLQALILFPSRELAKEGFNLLKQIAKYMNINCNICTGGINIKEQIQNFQSGEVQIVVGTPGRTNELIKRNLFNLQKLKMLIIEEVDEMIDIGFTNELLKILKMVPQECQIVLFTYTTRYQIIEFSKQFMCQLELISEIGNFSYLTLEGIRQYQVRLLSVEQKNETIIDILQILSMHQTIIYCNTKESVKELQFYIQQNAPEIIILTFFNGETENLVLNRQLEDIRKEQISVIITNDFQAQRISYYQFKLVINFEIPFNKEYYMQRIGRSGCYGRLGTAINFVLPDDVMFIDEIEKFYYTQIDQLPLDLSNL